MWVSKSETYNNNFDLSGTLLIDAKPLVSSESGITKKKSFGDNKLDLSTSNLETQIPDGSIPGPVWGDKKNMIVGLKNASGEWKTKEEDITTIVT